MLICCIWVFSLCRESPDMILGDESLVFEVVLSHTTEVTWSWHDVATESCCVIGVGIDERSHDV
jgi:hypothetical protein